MRHNAQGKPHRPPDCCMASTKGETETNCFILFHSTSFSELFVYMQQFGMRNFSHMGCLIRGSRLLRVA